VNGHHEPNVIMKDNDLKYKIRLPRHVAKRLVTQLENDAHFLHDIGVMDYSLLVGVHNTKYEVRGDVIAPVSPGSGSPPKPDAGSANPILSGGNGNYGDFEDSDVTSSRRLEVYSDCLLWLVISSDSTTMYSTGEPSGWAGHLYYGYH
jgi:hypothetical protein